MYPMTVPEMSSVETKFLLARQTLPEIARAARTLQFRYFLRLEGKTGEEEDRKDEEE